MASDLVWLHLYTEIATLCRSTGANAKHAFKTQRCVISYLRAQIKRTFYLNLALFHRVPLSPVCLILLLGLWSRRSSGLVHLGVEPVDVLEGRLLRAGHPGWYCGGGRTADVRLRRGRLAEVVDASVVWVAVIVLHVREGGRVRGGGAGLDLGVTRVEAVSKEERRYTGAQAQQKYMFYTFSLWFFVCDRHSAEQLLWRSRWANQSCQVRCQSQHFTTVTNAGLLLFYCTCCKPLCYHTLDCEIIIKQQHTECQFFGCCWGFLWFIPISVIRDPVQLLLTQCLQFALWSFCCIFALVFLLLAKPGNDKRVNLIILKPQADKTVVLLFWKDGLWALVSFWRL